MALFPNAKPSNPDDKRQTPSQASTGAFKPPEEPAAQIKPQEASQRTSDAPKTAQEDELAKLERSVSAYRVSWYQAGRDLAQIKGRDLYCLRAPNFDDYVRKMWGMTGRHARSLMRAAALVAPNIRDVSHAIRLSPALQLAKLPEDQQAPCLKEAIAASGSKSPSEKAVAAAVAARLPAKKKRRKGGKQKPVKLKLQSGSITLMLPAGADVRAALEEALAQITANSPRAAA